LRHGFLGRAASIRNTLLLQCALLLMRNGDSSAERPTRLQNDKLELETWPVPRPACREAFAAIAAAGQWN